jgi:pimeloyl-ACP methyl ester carboxylesterase
MAQTYLARYPERARTTTLRAVEPPGGILPLENPRYAQSVLEQIFDECRRETACGTAFPDLGGDLTTVIETLDARPATLRVLDPETGDSVEVTVTRGVFAGALRRLLMDGNAIPSIPLVVHTAAQGDYAALVPGITATLGVSRALYIGMSLSVGCAEDADRLARADIEGATAGTFMGADPARGFLEACDRWPRGTVPPAFYEHVTADVPVLLLSGRYDPTTPVSWAQQVADALGHSLHVIMDGISHSPFPPCAQDIMTQFVTAGGMVGVKTDCVQALERGAFLLPGAPEPS